MQTHIDTDTHSLILTITKSTYQYHEENVSYYVVNVHTMVSEDQVKRWDFMNLRITDDTCAQSFLQS